ncbi:MAG: ABC transporter permease [Actinomycetota bacterium]
MGVRRYLVRKCLGLLGTLVFALVLNFFLFRVMPGDPVRLLARQQELSLEEQQEQIELFGLDEPLGQQFVTYVGATLRGDFGISARTQRPVWDIIGERVMPTLLLVGLSTIFSMVFGLWIGIRGAWRRGSGFDKVTHIGSLALYSTPEGVLAIAFILVFSGWLGWFPAAGYSSPGLTGMAYVIDVLNHLVLPVLTLGLGYIGSYSVVMRESLLETMGEDYVGTARAKGLNESQVRRKHAVPNALLPTMTLVLYSFGYVIGGAVVTEYIFSFPGLGRLTAEAIGQQDFPLLQALFLLLTVSVLVFNLIADVLYGYLDPRVREG